MSTITFDFRHYYRKGERRESDQIAYQWDLGHVAEIYVPVNATYEIHYCFADFTETDDYAVESTTAAEDGGYKLTAHIPNKYFERSGELKVYVIGSDDNHVLTTYEGYISIRGRIKPDDYTDDDPENEATRILAEAREARDAAIEAAEQAEAAASQSAAQASIAKVYDATKTYSIGDYCLYDGQLYECTTEISTPEAWTAAHWTAATVGTELNDIKGDVTGLKEDLDAVVDTGYLPYDATYYPKWLNSSNVWTDYLHRRSTDYIATEELHSVTLTANDDAYIVYLNSDKSAIENLSALVMNTEHIINKSYPNCVIEIASTNSSALHILKDNSIIVDTFNELQASLIKEPFAYIGYGKKFIFRDATIFDNTGRCAWQLGDVLSVKMPNKTAMLFSMQDIITALGQDDTLVDGATTWVYLRTGSALVFNKNDNSLYVRVINRTTPLQKGDFPLLMQWSSQMVGGALYEKFLYDMSKATSPNINSRWQVNNNVLSLLDNSRHIKGGASQNTASVLTLLHFSDLHKDTSALSRIMSDAHEFSGLINDAICTGDMVLNSAEQISSWWNSSVMTCIGNHDSASYAEGVGYNWTALSMADRDNYYIAPFESNWGIVHTPGTSYYYKDYASAKVRLIVLDAMLYTDNGAEATAQTAWLDNLLSDAISNNYHVLIAIHAPHGGATAKDCSFSKYAQGVMSTSSDCNTPQIIIDTVSTKITVGLKFIGYIVGHTHQDNMWDAENDGKQLMYCVTCANVSNKPQWELYSDQHRSAIEDAYNLITIDTNHTLVKIVRGGGADVDNCMRTRKAISFNYSTGEVIGEVL